jgi:acetolactate synthase small subunit
MDNSGMTKTVTDLHVIVSATGHIIVHLQGHKEFATIGEIDCHISVFLIMQIEEELNRDKRQVLAHIVLLKVEPQEPNQDKLQVQDQIVLLKVEAREPNRVELNQKGYQRHIQVLDLKPVQAHLKLADHKQLLKYVLDQVQLLGLELIVEVVDLALLIASNIEVMQTSSLRTIASVLNANVDAMGHGAVLLAELLISVQILVENVE